jgi:hypothetical protein
VRFFSSLNRFLSLRYKKFFLIFTSENYDIAKKTKIQAGKAQEKKPLKK